MNLKNYESVIILTPVLSEQQMKDTVKGYRELITEQGGEIIHEDNWGLTKLAYPIQKKTTGIYWVLEYSGPTDLNEKLKIQILRDEQIMRHMITKLDKYAVEYNHVKRNGGFAVKQKMEA
jgi:small subunit ribosomal protein S6